MSHSPDKEPSALFPDVSTPLQRSKSYVVPHRTTASTVDSGSAGEEEGDIDSLRKTASSPNKKQSSDLTSRAAVSANPSPVVGATGSPSRLRSRRKSEGFLQGMSEAQLNKTFRHLDVNGSGTLSLDELLHATEELARGGGNGDGGTSTDSQASSRSVSACGSPRQPPANLADGREANDRATSLVSPSREPRVSTDIPSETRSDWETGRQAAHSTGIPVTVSTPSLGPGEHSPGTASRGSSHRGSVSRRNRRRESLVSAGVGNTGSRLASLFTLYLFDKSREGSINYSEFMEMMAQMRNAEEEAVERVNNNEDKIPSLVASRARTMSAPQSLHPDGRHRRGGSIPRIGTGSSPLIEKAKLSIAGSPSSNPSSTTNTHVCGATPAAHSAPISPLADPPASVPAPQRTSSPGPGASNSNNNNNNNNNMVSLKNTPKKMSTSFTRFPSPKGSVDSDPGSDQDPNPRLHRAVDVMWTEKYWGLFRPMLHDPNAMQDFRAWLFKLVDYDGSTRVSAEELRALLRVLENDGLDPKAFVFDSGASNSSSNLVAEEIIKQYDLGGSGDLTKDEFAVLADLIVSEYIRYDQSMNGSSQPIYVGPFRLTRVLGDGTYGIVHLGVDTVSRERRAIKVIQKGNVRQMSRLDNEIMAMAKLSHPRVVHLHDVYETQTHTYISMELCEGGSLYEQVIYNPLPEDTARYYFAQLLDGLAYCHSRRVCHRDIRIENLLLDNEGNVKISDFGHAGMFKKGWDIFTEQLVGSLYYMAPEQVQNECYSGVKLDAWACGVVLHYLLLRRPPFWADNVQDLFERIVEGKLDLPDTLSIEVRDLLLTLLSVDPESRPSVRRVRKHPWVLAPATKPRLTQYEMPLVGTQYRDLDAVWSSVTSLLKSNPEISVYANSSPQEDSVTKRSKCRHRTYEFKFSVILTNTSSAPESMEPGLVDGRITNPLSVAIPSPSADHAYLLFVLKDGESRLFGEFIHQLQDDIKAQIVGSTSPASEDARATPSTATPQTPVPVTRHFDAAASMTPSGTPHIRAAGASMGGADSEMSFDGSEQMVITDSQGMFARGDLPLAAAPLGPLSPLAPQGTLMNGPGRDSEATDPDDNDDSLYRTI